MRSDFTYRKKAKYMKNAKYRKARREEIRGAKKKESSMNFGGRRRKQRLGFFALGLSLVFLSYSFFRIGYKALSFFTVMTGMACFLFAFPASFSYISAFLSVSFGVLSLILEALSSILAPEISLKK